ncbi:hypothetical protein GMDG_06813 [Pseudogymnoascus destructans 20631-21]|uniref:Uncharacterized protein n=1 Tax=Pseudogymnoascus destructans (strain ATCC MYA-4855 / 20631-21) TaxID=658429 RepID=L8FVL6_PSED2|nr:hypothetical protein GMDG_06813 [Pseudogymnoascus destructans 20631-21]
MAPTSGDAPQTLGVGWRTDEESIVAAERLDSASRSSSPDTVIFDPEFAAGTLLRRQSGHRASGLFSPQPPTLGSQPDNIPYKFPTRATPHKLPQPGPEVARRYTLGQSLPDQPLEFPVIDTYREREPHRTPDRQPPPTPRFAPAPFEKPTPPPQSPQRRTPKLQLLRGSPERSPSRTQNPSSPRFRIRGNYRPALNNMSYQNYLDTPQTGSAPGPRQAPSPSQGMPHANGANGAPAMPGMMGGLPTPAGHQSDLNAIYNMVETLHNELAETRARSERIVAAAGIIRARALEQDLTAEQIAAGVAAELNEGTKNLEGENSRLRHALSHATHEEAAYKALCEEFAVTMGNALELCHAYKLKTTLDMCAWHRSYRDQLAAERAENVELRCRISDMQASAARGMEQMRLFRRGWDRSDLVMEMRAEIVSLRQQARGWKRVALSELASDDSEFSDDDDVVDPEEKKRLRRVEENRVREEGEGEGDGGGAGAGEGVGGDEACGDGGEITI